MNNFVLTPEILTEFELETQNSYNVRAIVLLVENKRFKEAYNLNLLGKPMKDWVRNAVKNFENRFVTLEESDNPLEVIKPFIRDEDYTIVLFSDTPVLQENTVLEVLDYATTKNLDYCKLPRGFILKSQNFKANKIENSAEPTFISKEDFYTFFDGKTLSTCKQILKERILDIHTKNKVIIHDKNSTYIECNVEIAPFVEIYPFNSIRGETKIEKDVTLFEHNLIVNSTICQNNTLTSTYLENTILPQKSNLAPFSALKEEIETENLTKNNENDTFDDGEPDLWN